MILTQMGFFRKKKLILTRVDVFNLLDYTIWYQRFCAGSIQKFSPRRIC